MLAPCARWLYELLSLVGSVGFWRLRSTPIHVSCRRLEAEGCAEVRSSLASVEGERRREFTGGVDLGLQAHNLLRGTRNGVRTGDEPPRRRVLRDGQQCASFTGSPDCLPSCDFEYSMSGALRSS
jgi:hypothetical protein